MFSSSVAKLLDLIKVVNYLSYWFVLCNFDSACFRS